MNKAKELIDLITFFRLFENYLITEKSDELKTAVEVITEALEKAFYEALRENQKGW
jgi:hypothetical protein